MPVKLNLQEQEEVGLKLKAKGRQRFRLVSARRQSDGNLVGQVTLLPEIDLGDPLDGVRLKSQDRYRRNQWVAKDYHSMEEMDGTLKEEVEMSGGGCFERLHSAMRRRESNISPITNSSDPVPIRRRRSHCQGVTRLSFFIPLCAPEKTSSICRIVCNYHTL